MYSTHFEKKIGVIRMSTPTVIWWTEFYSPLFMLLLSVELKCNFIIFSP